MGSTVIDANKLFINNRIAEIATLRGCFKRIDLRPTMRVKIYSAQQHREFTALLDSGSEVYCITVDAMNELGATIGRSTQTLTVANGAKLVPEGSARLSLEIGRIRREKSFNVIKSLRYDIILSWEVILDFELTISGGDNSCFILQAADNYSPAIHLVTDDKNQRETLNCPKESSGLC